MTTTRLNILLPLLLSSLAASGWAAEHAAVSPKAPWGRIVMVGASATAGFTVGEMLGGTNTPFHRLSRYLDAAIVAPHEPVENLAHALFFMQPEAARRSQITEAIEAQPTLVVGIDFLFWFCYGDLRSDEDRLRRFEKGLKMLEEISCPLILGDIPDASAAIATGMLTEKQMPSAKVMAAANSRLKEWAAARPQVVLVPLAAFMRAAQANEAITVRGRTLPEGQTRALLQDDRLHPSPRGAAVLALAILDAFQSARPGLSTNDVRWNHEQVLRLGYKSSPAQPPRVDQQRAISKPPASPGRQSDEDRSGVQKVTVKP